MPERRRAEAPARKRPEVAASIRTTAATVCQAGTLTSELRNGMKIGAVGGSMDNRATQPALGRDTAATAAT